jgi:undecaprenyl-diphosphatase
MTSKSTEKPDPKQEAAEAEPVKDALTSALRAVDTPAKAEATVAQLEKKASGETAEEALEAERPKQHAAEAVDEVERAADAAPPGQKASEVLVETARAVETTHGEAQAALAEATEQVLDPEREGAEAPEQTQRRRDLLRQALFRRLKPAQAVDARLFIWVNHLPHNRVTNGFFHFLTMAFHGGAAWYALVGAAMLAQGRWSQTWWREVVIPLTAASAVVEGPIKSYFRRRRPFIDLVRAIVIGKKPGTWSFPSGHAATAFAGAYLMRRLFPSLRWFFYPIAGLVAFSRVYLGVHYPGDVLIGSVSGHVLAQVFGWLFRRLRAVRRPSPFR